MDAGIQTKPPREVLLLQGSSKLCHTSDLTRSRCLGSVVGELARLAFSHKWLRSQWIVPLRSAARRLSSMKLGR